jgi:GNAT superfamily N-acetyltransferase
MALATWWNTDPLPSLTPLTGFEVVLASDSHELAEINRISHSEVVSRFNDGHHPYVAYIDGNPVAYGWVASLQASIGELGLNFMLSSRDHYLWDFATLPEWQGQGLYPRLLQAIVDEESKITSRFWIIHAPENLPSGAGMNKAGFEFVGQLSFTLDGSVGLAPYDSDSTERAQIGAELLGVPLIDSVLAPCWHCGGSVSKHPDRADAATCWPPVKPGEANCNCAVEVKSPKRVTSEE